MPAVISDETLQVLSLSHSLSLSLCVCVSVCLSVSLALVALSTDSLFSQQAVAKYRSRGRIPAVVWRHPRKRKRETRKGCEQL